MKDKLLNRFLKYVKINTMSDSRSTTYPSSTIQIDFGKQLVEECKQIGLQDVSIDNYGYVMATLPANTKTDAPVIGFISHMDTVPDYPGVNVKPNIIENYSGGPIVLNKEQNVVMDPGYFEILDKVVGKTLITTDGTTVLGADDKAGIAEILTAMEYLISHPEIKHGEIKVGFTPDEEIGHGVDHFDVNKFGAKYAFTIDGCGLGELECENFNAAGATVKFKGISVHPGSAKGKMVNASSIACDFHSMLPTQDAPEYTEMREGFFHLHAMEGDIENATLEYIIRDHDKAKFENRKETLKNLVTYINNKYGSEVATVEMADNYYNMKEIIDKHPEPMELAKKAFAKAEVTPEIMPIRGGTDGARLSFMGLPCPNIFVGAYNCHGKYEFAVVEYMLKATEIIVAMCELNV